MNAKKNCQKESHTSLPPITNTAHLKSDFTLLIPTYNRPDSLKKLLNYLQIQDVSFLVVVLDSSTAENIEKNKKLIERVSLHIQHIIYPNETPPFQKFSAGFQLVTTPFCAMCADDDILFTDAISKCVEFLQKNSEYSLAHGFYCDFFEQQRGQTNELSIERLIYTQDSLDINDSTQRLVELLKQYEATTYAIHRTKTAQIAFEKAASLQNILFQELLSSLLCVLQGKTARIPMLYAARNNERTIHYSLWHPLELITHSPEKLLNEYLPYKNILINTIQEHASTKNTLQYNAEELGNIIDLAHLLYLIPYIRREILNFALTKKLNKESSNKVSPELWQYWTSLQSTPKSRFFYWVYHYKQKILPHFSISSFINRFFGKVKGDLIHNTILPQAQINRRYQVSGSFQKQMIERKLEIKYSIEKLFYFLNSYF